MLFESVSGLKVNFHKSMLYGSMFMILGYMRRLRWCTVNMVDFLSYIWGCLLVVIRGRSLFGTL